MADHFKRKNLVKVIASNLAFQVGQIDFIVIITK
jgi:hypothetical protein